MNHASRVMARATFGAALAWSLVIACGCERHDAARPRLRACPERAASALPSGGEPEPGGELTIGLDFEPPHLQPMVGGGRVFDVVEAVLLHDVVQTLVRWDRAGGRFAPELASAWSAQEGGKRLTFQLVPAVWHDGRPFTSDDVVFTFERLLDPAERVPFLRDDFDHVVRFSAPDPTRFVLELSDGRRATLASLADLPILPRHVFGRAPVTNHPANRAPIGTGPYRLAEWIPGREIRIDRIAGASAGHLDRVRYVFARSDAAALALARRGGLDLARLRTVYGSTLRWEGLDRFERLEVPRPGLHAIVWRTDRSPFDSVELRRAIALRADTRLRSDGACLLPEVTWPGAVDLGLPPPVHDVRAAERLLERLGYLHWTGEGLRFRRIEGRLSPLRIQLAAFTNAVALTSVHAIRPQLMASGIQLQFKMEGSGRWARLMNGDVNAVLVSWLWRGSDVDLFGLLHSSRAWPTGANVGLFRNARVDRLLERLRSDDLDDSARRALQVELYQTLSDLQPMLPVRPTPETWVVSKKVRGFDPLDPRTRDLWIL